MSSCTGSRSEAGHDAVQPGCSASAASGPWLPSSRPSSRAFSAAAASSESTSSLPPRQRLPRRPDQAASTSSGAGGGSSFPSVTAATTSAQYQFETGKYARLADGSVVVRVGDCEVLATAVCDWASADASRDFHPLQVSPQLTCCARLDDCSAASAPSKAAAPPALLHVCSTSTASLRYAKRCARCLNTSLHHAFC